MGSLEKFNFFALTFYQELILKNGKSSSCLELSLPLGVCAKLENMDRFKILEIAEKFSTNGMIITPASLSAMLEKNLNERIDIASESLFDSHKKITGNQAS
ncbi:hypothetical protein [Hydrogenovibrio marinus]|uniref:Uncharacterized protein n=1 Tax=Hydrogenovibrio marinus TaxID=28885 RepID=A0A066ZMM4_HYDMR|nr:hypothetical protein [Hydrogenovibrio marinus]KDN94732.1 hypothetical protein EI16_12625 [Hydrogenovibrio marinus]